MQREQMNGCDDDDDDDASFELFFGRWVKYFCFNYSNAAAPSYFIERAYSVLTLFVH